MVIRPDLRGIGATDFEQKNEAILQGEKATLAAVPQIRARLAAMEATRQAAALALQATQARP